MIKNVFGHPFWQLPEKHKLLDSDKSTRIEEKWLLFLKLAPKTGPEFVVRPFAFLTPIFVELCVRLLIVTYIDC